jgi:hypothetical protein
MKFAAIFSALALFGVLTGCNSMKVTSTVAPGYDFSGINTYEWVDAPVEILEEEDTYIHEGLQGALNNELAALGLKQVIESSAADARISYYIKLSEHEEYSAQSSPQESQLSGGVTFNSKEKGWSIREQQEDLNVYTVEVGILTVLVHDAKSGDQIWKGTLKTKVDRSVPLEKLKEYFRVVSSKVMTGFPVAAK